MPKHGPCEECILLSSGFCHCGYEPMDCICTPKAPRCSHCGEAFDGDPDAKGSWCLCGYCYEQRIRDEPEAFDWR